MIITEKEVTFKDINSLVSAEKWLNEKIFDLGLWQEDLAGWLRNKIVKWSSESHKLKTTLNISNEEIDKLISYNFLIPAAKKLYHSSKWQTGKREVSIMICDMDDVFTNFLTDEIEEEFGANNEIRIDVVTHAEEMLTLSKRYDYDLFIVGINNTQFYRFPELKTSPRKRMMKTLKLISFLKSNYDKPVISFINESLNSPFIQRRSKAAGVSFFFTKPFNIKQLINIIEQSLSYQNINDIH